MMTRIETIQSYLHEHIPLSQAIGSTLKVCTDNQVVVTAPLANNINHKQTVFGGSLHAVATLACWTLLYQNLFDILDKVEIVIARSEVDYIKAVTDDFEAVCIKPEEAVWQKFYDGIARKGKSRIPLHALIHQSDKLAVDYHGQFVVLSS